MAGDRSDQTVVEPNMFSAAWRHRRFVTTCALAGLVLAVIYALVRPRPPEFSATATVVIQDPGSGESAPVAPSDRFITGQVATFQSSAVAERASELTAVDGGEPLLTPAEVASHLSVGSAAQSSLVVVRISADTPEKAVTGVNAVVDAYEEFSRQQQTRAASAALERIDAQLSSLDERFEAIQEDTIALQESNVTTASLQRTYDEATAEVAVLLEELSSASPSRVEAIQNRLEILREQIDTYRLVINTSPQSPELTALAEEQDQIIRRRAVLLERRDQIAIDAELAPTPAALISPASAAFERVGSGVGRFAAVGLVGGLVGGVGLAFLMSTRRRSFTARSEPESLLAAPLLADIPDFAAEHLDSPLPVRDAPRSAAAEAFRFAAASIERKMELDNVKSLAVVATFVGHGKTTAVANAALASARQGKRVLVVDADFGSQGASEMLTGGVISIHQGLTDVLEGGAPLKDALVWVDIGAGARVALLGRGLRPVLAADILRTRAARDLFTQVQDEFDLILIDAPPLLQVAYTSTLVGYADTVLVVVPHESQVAPLVEMARRLDLLGARVFGYLYNKSPLRPEMMATEGSMRDVLGDQGRVRAVSARTAKPRWGGD